MLNILTIVLDGEPWIERHLSQFEALKIPWHWHIVHGASMNGGSTRWCRPQAPRLSGDGTTEYLRGIRHRKNVTVYERQRWDSKDQMVNAPTGNMKAGVLMQVDSDELWSTEKLEEVVEMFRDHPRIDRAYFHCNYFVGPGIITVGENCYGCNPDEWLRAWRFIPGMRFTSHEPPRLGRSDGIFLPRSATRRMGIIFNHMAYATEKQVSFKEKFYGYKGAVEQWKALQSHPGPWPIKLKRFLPWVDDRVEATAINHFPVDISSR